MSVRVSLCLSVCTLAVAFLDRFWDREVTTPKSNNEFVWVNIVPPLPLFCPSKTIFGAWIGVFKPKLKKIIKTCIISKVLYRFQPNFGQWKRPPNALCDGWSKHAHHKSKMADGRHLQKIEKSPYLGNGLTDCHKILHLIQFDLLDLSDS